MNFEKWEFDYSLTGLTEAINHRKQAALFNGPSRTHRYLWWHILDEVKRARADRMLHAWLHNPSKAHGYEFDPTAKKLCGFASRLGCDGVIISNTHAGVATDMAELESMRDPVGSMCDFWNLFLIYHTKMTVAGWGNSKWAKVRQPIMIAMAQMAKKDVYCFDENDDGSPKHPLYVGYDELPLKVYIEGE